MRRTAFILLTALLLGCGRTGRNEKTISELSISKIKLTELNGQPIDLSQYEGKVVFINFWATWCKPCILEMPTIESIQDIMKDQNIVFLLASNEENDEIEAFSKGRNFRFHYVRLDNLEELNIQALPTTFIFDAQGKLKFSEAGYRKWDSRENVNMIKDIISHEK